LIKQKLDLYIIFFINIFVLSHICATVVQSNDTFTVKWIGEFNSTRSWEKDADFFERIFDFILGADHIELIRPVNIVANNEKFWILDQGSKKVKIIDFRNKETDNILDINEDMFPSLVGICQDEKENIYVSDSQQNKIVRIQSGNKSREIFAENINLNKPTGIAYSVKTKKIYVCETGNHRIVVLNQNGEKANEIGKHGKSEYEFNFPTFIWVDKDGYIYVVDSMNFRIQIFDSNGKLVSIFGEPGDGTGYLARPKGIATDSYGNIYIVEALFHNVQVFNKQGEFLYYFGKQGRGKGEFWLPMGIYIDELNKIYISDSFNSRIQIFQLENRNNIEN
jgi:DNA-binding beta-propeller fold protein YncE